ncbi:MAG: DUF5678 domain-containing protein [Thaumarchaeota archaeon]|nr:DUF5678 domain-containing protein [Nitrososphaerota archaeon]
MASATEILSEHDRNLDWFNAHYKELKKKYLDRWVAVKNSQVVDYDRSYLTLAKRAKRKYRDDFSKLAIGYVSEKPIELIL